MRWGSFLLGKTAEEADRLSRQTLNARNDGVFSKPSFRSSIRTRRCLIPVNGFMRIVMSRAGNSLISSILPIQKSFGLEVYLIAGQTGTAVRVIDSCSIITTNANHLMSKIHNLKLRMPLIIPEDKLLIWLDPDLPDESIQQLMQPYPEKKMEAYTVSKLVNRKETTPTWKRSACHSVIPSWNIWIHSADKLQYLRQMRWNWLLIPWWMTGHAMAQTDLPVTTDSSRYDGRLVVAPSFTISLKPAGHLAEVHYTH